MITTITLNPAIDRTIVVNDLEMGQVNRITSAREDIGGKGINVAKVLKQLNDSTKAIGFIGINNKKKVYELLDLENMNYQFIEVEAFTRINTKIVDHGNQLTTDLNEQGFSINTVLYEDFKSMLREQAIISDYMVFSGSIPVGLSKETYKDLIKLVKENTLTVLDADGELLVEGIKAGPFLIKPNIHELEAAFKTSLNDEKDIIKLSLEIIEKYDVKMVLISMGGDGSILVTQKEVLKAEPIKVVVNSTVGAGDSMLAGIVHGIANGLSLSDSLVFATACGTLAVTQEGTQSFSMEEVLEVMKQVHISSL
ncbi:MAG: 1-phosphofructokinase [Firmicutes bacterium HGW-Firmicutes-1]|jgi:1-phosphofructokinase|nr:MAG: 1-phosphofructokinase [Firmicutes bacterium HGW-Firmicutes-1]